MYEVDFLPVGNSNGDAICVRYGTPEQGYYLHVIDGGYADTADTIIRHIETHFSRDWFINHMVVSHADNDHCAGLVGVMERFEVKNLWMNRPWLYVDKVLDSFHGNFSRRGLVGDIREKHDYLVRLEDLASDRGTPIHEVFQGAVIGAFTVLAPSRARYIRLIPDLDKTPTSYAQDSTGLASLLIKAFEAAKEWVDERWDLETLTMMRRDDTALDTDSKDRYRAFLASKLARTTPTAAEERQNQAGADAFYEQAGTWLRENTRDTKKFSLLFNENISYGYRRNLLGLKWVALGLNLIVVAICAGLLWRNAPVNIDDPFTGRVLVVLVVAVIHAVYIVAIVNQRIVIAAARTYARQLILSTETFLAAGKKPKATKKAS